MKIAVGSDMKTHLTDVLVDELRKRGYIVEVFGALIKEPALWSKVAVEVAKKVSTGEYRSGSSFLLDRNRYQSSGK